MTYPDFCQHLNELLKVDEWAKIDDSQNGLQVQPGNLEVKKVALAVDACQNTFEQAVTMGVDLLIVHHGLLWGHSQPVTDFYFNRLKTLIGGGVGLYACHLPLDAHPQMGHNAQLADLLDLKNRQKLNVGWQGDLALPLKIEDITDKLGLNEEKHVHVEKFGPEEITHVGIISGGAGHHSEIWEAVENNCDLYITGELTHTAIHYAQEAGMNLLGAGHYWSERFGLWALKDYLDKKTGVETVWLENPTDF